MPSAIDTEPPAASHKAEKKSKKEKKRARDDEELTTTPRKHKRSKSEAVPVADLAAETSGAEGQVKPKKDKKDKKKKKHKKSKDSAAENGADPAAAEPEPEDAAPPADADANEVVAETPVKSKKSKKEKRKAEKAAEEGNAADSEGLPEARAEPDEDGVSETPEKKKKKKRSRRKPDPATEEAAQSPAPHGSKAEDGGEPDGGRMDVDEGAEAAPSQAPGTILQPAHAPADPEFPFVTQTVSLYVPLFPSGFDQPLTKVAEQHLKPLLNHYSSLFKGVLLDYRHVTLAETPTRADPRAPPTDRTPTLLACRDEYAVGFGWLTAEVYLFVPRRGAWMEGTVNLHSEGHLGVVCWGRFNASLEARRVPRGWRFVDVVQRAEDAKKARFRNAGKKTTADDAADAAWQAGGQDGPGNEADEGQEDLESSLQQMHATGYWVDAEGRRVQGKLRFRIKNYDVGTAGDHGYISIEGTMLDDEAEKALLAKEKERERARKLRNSRSGMLTREMRPVPKFSVTNFGPEDEEEDTSKKQPMYFASRPGTPDD